LGVGDYERRDTFPRVRSPDPDSGDRPATKDTWMRLPRRILARLPEDELTDRAGALTYYAMLAVFPALVLLFGLLALVGPQPETQEGVGRVIGKISPDAQAALRGSVDHFFNTQGGAGVLVGASIVVGLWSASGYLSAFVRASYRVSGLSAPPAAWRLRPLAFLAAIAAVLGLAVAILALVLTGRVARAVLSEIGFGSEADGVWSVIRWPLIIVVVSAFVSLLFRLRPAEARTGWLTPGILLSVACWILGSVGFGLYVQWFGRHDATYGALAGAIVLLIWLWLSNLALLAGLVVDDELGRVRRADEGTG